MKLKHLHSLRIDEIPSYRRDKNSLFTHSARVETRQGKHSFQITLDHEQTERLLVQVGEVLAEALLKQNKEILAALMGESDAK